MRLKHRREVIPAVAPGCGVTLNRVGCMRGRLVLIFFEDAEPTLAEYSSRRCRDGRGIGDSVH